MNIKSYYEEDREGGSHWCEQFMRIVWVVPCGFLQEVFSLPMDSQWCDSTNALLHIKTCWKEIWLKLSFERWNDFALGSAELCEWMSLSPFRSIRQVFSAFMSEWSTVKQSSERGEIKRASEFQIYSLAMKLYFLLSKSLQLCEIKLGFHDWDKSVTLFSGQRNRIAGQHILYSHTVYCNILGYILITYVNTL